MAKTICKYIGGLRCEAVFEPTGDKILTDAPVEMKGQGEHFSPTDLMAAALGTCIVTMMGVTAEREGISLQEVTVEVEKEMGGPPPHISAMRALVHMPAGMTSTQRTKLEKFAHNCPVHGSLPTEMDTSIEFVYPD